MMEALEEEESDASSVGNDSPEAYTNAVVSVHVFSSASAIVSYSSKVENVHETSLILPTNAHSIGKIPSIHFMTLLLLFYSVIGANNLSDMLVLSPRRARELELGAYDLNFDIDNVLVNFNLNYHDDDRDDDDLLV
jgi:hypothetical protein